MLEDGIHTVAIGHKEYTANIEQDRIENPAADEVIMFKDAKHFGRLWRVRNGAYHRLGFDPTQRPEETDEQAQQAGAQMREHVRQMLAPLPDLPDRYNPEEVRPPSRRRHAASFSAEPTGAKYSRIQRSSISEDEFEAFQEPE